MARYEVVEESVSAHCCFEATVIDKQKEWMCGDTVRFETVCECFSVADAKLVCDALNASTEQ